MNNKAITAPQGEEPVRRMRPRHPESQEERAARLLARVRHFTTPDCGNLETAAAQIPSMEEIKNRIAGRLAAADTSFPVAEQVAQQYAVKGLKVVEQVARQEITLSDLTDDSVNALEAVVSVVGRPAWYVRENAPETEESESAERRDDEFWIVMVSNAGKALRQVCSRTACVMKQTDGDRVPVGTGWVIGNRLLVTNAHVAGHVARQKPNAGAADPRKGWRLRPDTKGIAEFIFEHERKATLAFDIADVLYVEDADTPDIAIFRLAVSESGPPLPPAISLDLEAGRPAGWKGMSVFAVGHPIADLNDDKNVATVFGALDGTKRLSPGKILDLLGGNVLAHDCSTTAGSSGSPLVDFASLKAVGLHYFGEPGKRNEAVMLGAVAAHPAIAKSINNGWEF